MRTKRAGRISRRLAAVFAGALLALSCPAARADDSDVRIAGAPSVAPILVDMAHAMTASKGLHFHYSPQGGSDGGIEALGQGVADIAVITRPLAGSDQAVFPDVIMKATPIGAEAVAIGVANDVWDGGVHAISKETMRSIYELKTKRWNEIDGPDEKVAFFNFEEGHGTWEIFAQWMYEDNRKAPIPKVERLHSSSDAAGTLEFTPGAIAPISPLMVDGSQFHALSIIIADGKQITPTPSNVAKGTYPLTRPIVLVTNGRPTLNVRKVVEFLTGPEGQAILRKNGAFGLDAVPKPKDDSED